MITRIWRGWTSPENADAYERLLLEEIFPGIESKGLAGYLGISLLRRALEGEVEFNTIMWFESLDSVREFAGHDYETAVVPPKPRALLARFDAKSQHFLTIVPPTLLS
ncbi:MAG: antibiotic biosynthesis monooxygenase [Candidatus Eremiobacteraeota bacterium]|nr:antibiotic biosynthesis monooxygenase [Candidatus Eremiobacteraeota bacterium]